MMAMIVTGMDMPESCKRCPIRYDCYRWVRFLQTQTTTACHPKMEGCQIKSVEGLIEKIEQAKQYKGKSGNPIIDSHDIGLDRYFDFGLEKAIRIIKEYCGLEENNGNQD